MSFLQTQRSGCNLGTIYIDTGGSATNSGSTDVNAASVSGSAATNVGTTVTLDAGTDLSSVVTTAGATQSSIYINDATNSNKKIFWISAVAGSGGATPTVTVDTAPTGVTLSTWAIGGRVILTNAAQEGALRGGDVAVFNNSPASSANALWTFRIAGDTNGMAKVIGKSGTRPVLTCTGTANVISGNSLFNCYIENLECRQTGASGTAVLLNGNLNISNNVKVSSATGVGINAGLSTTKVVNCEVLSVTTSGIMLSNSAGTFFGNYVHDIGGDGFLCNVVSGAAIIISCIFDTCAGRGILFSGSFATGGATNTVIANNTVYGCGNSGFESSDVDFNIGLFFNNIFMNNGDAANEYNFEFLAGTCEIFGLHGWNVFNKASNNVLGLTINSTESTSDPLFVDAPNGDFRIAYTSPATGAGYPGVYLGGPTGYLDMGAVQRKEDYPGATQVLSGVTFGNGNFVGSLSAGGGGASFPQVTSLGQYNWLD